MEKFRFEPVRYGKFYLYGRTMAVPDITRQINQQGRFRVCLFYGVNIGHGLYLLPGIVHLECGIGIITMLFFAVRLV
jgi:hypothetical protein